MGPALIVQWAPDFSRDVQMTNYHPRASQTMNSFTSSSNKLHMSVPSVAVLIIGFALLASPTPTQAQRGGGGGHGTPTGIGGGGGRPGGVSEKDDLKDFHHALAVQATAEQRAAFARIAQSTQAASDQLKTLRESLQKNPAPSALSGPATTLDQTIEEARAGSKNFLASFSSTQKSGLKDITKKVVKADSELEKQSETLPHIAQTAKLESEQISASAAGLDKALTAFQSEQLALGAEMGILLATNSSDLTFNLPKATASIDIGGDRPIPIAASGALSRTSAQSGNNQFSFKLIADLSELQPEVTAILRSQLNRSPRCGDRLEIVQATLTPSDPAALVVANVHHERWICPSSSKENAMEVDDSNGVVEITLTPFVEPKWRLAPRRPN